MLTDESSGEDDSILLHHLPWRSTGKLANTTVLIVPVPLYPSYFIVSTML